MKILVLAPLAADAKPGWVPDDAVVAIIGDEADLSVDHLRACLHEAATSMAEWIAWQAEAGVSAP